MLYSGISDESVCFIVSLLFYKQQQKVSVVEVKFGQNQSVNLGFLVIVISNTADTNVAIF